jgi:hypothetical protein
MAKVKVYPKTAVAMHKLMAHPVDGVLRADGSHWEDDTWTYRRLRDGDITLDEKESVNAPKAPEEVFVTPMPKKPKVDVSGV